MVQKKKIKKVQKVQQDPKLPKVKKELKDFMADDEGKMTRKDVAKLGVSLAVLGMMMQSSAKADSWAVTPGKPAHTNVVNVQNGCAVHTNVTTQIDTHSNHSQGGWMC